jgi:hypothetical protein
MLKDLGVSKGWVRDTLGISTKTLDKRLRRCGIE